jgi:hypothetical protein
MGVGFEVQDPEFKDRFKVWDVGFGGEALGLRGLGSGVLRFRV